MPIPICGSVTRIYQKMYQIGMIERDEVDIGVTDFYANRERAEVTDFSVIIGYAELVGKYLKFSMFLNILFRNRFFIKFPGRDFGGVLSFLKGFRNDAWLALSLFVCILPVFLYLYYQILCFNGFYEEQKYTFGNNFLIFLAALAQQVSVYSKSTPRICGQFYFRGKMQLLNFSAQGWFSSSCLLQALFCSRASGMMPYYSKYEYENDY